MITEALRMMVAHKRDRYTFSPYHNGDIEFGRIPKETGLYLHVPFCRFLCPFCPYNKTVYSQRSAKRYFAALLKEFDMYRPFLNGKTIGSVYIGGGTPTLLLEELKIFLERLKETTGFCGDVGIEVHPLEATPQNFAAAKEAEFNMVSVGVQTFAAKSLRFLERGYGPEESHRAVRNAVQAGFDTVDVDLMYNIPGQTEEDMKKDLMTCLAYGVDQVSNYPLIVFPLTPLGKKIKSAGLHRYSEIAEYRLQQMLTRIAAENGYERTSIWTYGKKNAKRYTSVTRETFLGLGASATSLYADYFYVNTFNVEEYIRAIESGRMPISLVNHMNEREKQVFWLFWRCYDTVISRQGFHNMFGQSLDKKFPLLTTALKVLGLARDYGEALRLTSLGSFCYHFVEKQYSLRYLNKLWSVSMGRPWPERLEL